MKKSFKGFTACLMAALLVIPAFTGAFAEITPASINAADITAQMKLPDRILEAKQITSKLDVSGIRNGRTLKAAEVEAKEGINPTDIVTIMVKLDADPAVKVFKNLKGVNAQEYRAQLLSAQAEAAAVLSSKLNAAVEPVNNYSVLFNGFSFEGEYRLIGEINAMNGYHAFMAPEWGAPELFNTVSQVHAVEAWDLDYTGEGQLVAIIDTGCKIDHPAFSIDPENPAYTQEQIAEILPETHAAGSSAAQIYRSGKIPFGWNYEGSNADIAHHYNDHGTHVAGIAAGNGGEIKGVAPDAQIAVMQVFAPTGGAKYATILLALEDAAVLGAAAANLSLGHVCGDEDYGDPAMEEALDNAVEAGVNLSMSAGNNYNAAFQNAWGGYSLVENPDYGVVGGPSTGLHGMSVAAVQNSKCQGFYIQPVGGAGTIYIENEENMVKMADKLGGQTLEYVMIPGVGKVEDYEGLDVTGKVAFVQRGDISFVEKGYIAQDHGAAACVIWNNVPGDVLRMVPFGTIDENNHIVHDGNEGMIPHISITYEAGMSFMENEDKHIFISAEFDVFDAPDGDQTCGFSSWGVPSTMGMKPEIAAPGGQIYSSTDPAFSGGLYSTWDGTSMAAPHISGGMAIIRQYVEEKFPNLNPEQKHDMVNCILMSTATPLYDEGGSYASPRHQGAGEMNMLKAVTTNAYITVEGTQGNRPKINLGDDPEKTGNYELTFTVHNFGEEELNYTVQPSVLLDEIAMLGQLPDGTPIFVYAGYSWDIYNDNGTEYLLGDVDCSGVVTVADAVLVLRLAMGLIDDVDNLLADVNQDGEVTVADAILAARIALQLEESDSVMIRDEYAEIAPTAVTVPANGETEVKMTLTLTDMAKEYIDEYYDSGAHVEGFIELIPVENETEPSLTVPFMGFYGDWNYPRTVGDGYYYEDICLNSNAYPNTVGYKKGKEIQPLGFNPFVETEDLAYYLADRNAISANGDKMLDTVNLMYMDIERNSYIRYVVCDTEGNELGEIQDIGVCTKGFFDDGSMSRDQLGVNYCPFPGNYDFAQYGKDDLIIRIEAKLNNNGIHTTAAFTPEANKCWKWDIPLHLDTIAPEIDGFAAAEGKFTFNVIDEHYVAYAGVYTIGEEANTLGELVDEIGVFETERGMATSIELNGEANNYVLIGDYAGNVAAYLWDGEALAPVEIVEPTPVGNFTEAHLFTYSDLTDPSAWVHFMTTDVGGIDFAEDTDNASNLFAAGSSYNPDDGKAYVTTKEQSGSPMLYKFDFDAENSLLSNPQLVGMLTVDEGAEPLQLINEMTYFPLIGKFIGIERAGGLYIIDPATAQCALLGGLGYGMVAMDASPEGLLYIIDENGQLHEVNLLADEPTDEIIADTGIVPIVGGNFIFVQGGCLIGNTFYWHSAIPAGNNIATQLVRIDITTGAVEEMGFLLQDGFATAGLFGFPID